MSSEFDEDLTRTLYKNNIRREGWLKGWVEGWNEGWDKSCFEVWNEVWNAGRNDAWHEGRKKGRIEGRKETISMLRNMGIDESILSEAIANIEARAQEAGV